MDRVKKIMQWVVGIRYLIPLTPLGACVTFLACWILWKYSIREQDFVLYASSSLALIVILFVFFVLVFATVILWIRIRKKSGNIEVELQTKKRSATDFFLPRFDKWPIVQIQLQWIEPYDVDVDLEASGSQLQELVLPKSRGRYRSLRRRFIVTDIFGLCRLGFTKNYNIPLRIQPSKTQMSPNIINHLTSGDALSHPTGLAEGELLDMRRYVHGDSMRRVLWKAFARTRQLLVRMPERAITPNPSAIAYFVAGKQDEATASVARYCIEHGLLGQNFYFCADGSNEPTSNVADALEQLIVSSHYKKNGAQGLSNFINRMDTHRLRTFILFVPPTNGPWLAHVEHVAKRIPGANVIVSVPSLVNFEPYGKIKQIFFATKEGPSLPGFSTVIKRLKANGLQVRVVNHNTGILIPSFQLEAIFR